MSASNMMYFLGKSLTSSISLGVIILKFFNLSNNYWWERYVKLNIT